MSCDDRVPNARCCDSCHEDKDEYGYDMVYISDWTEVCCWVARALEEAGIA